MNKTLSMTPEQAANEADRDALFNFPCAFPVKIMGLAETTLAQSVLDIILQFDAAFDGKTMEMHASSSGKYVSLTCTITATSRAQLDAMYLQLSKNPLVKAAL